MEKENNPQLELFSRPDDPSGPRTDANNSLLKRIWNYEKTILIILAMLVTGIIAFSLGVEKGKMIAVSPQNPAPAAVSQPVIRKGAAVNPPTPSLRKQGAFTIQVATFKTKANARKEAANINKMGLDAIILTRGDYIILCAGNFPSQEAAQPLVGELNKRYGNCSIRRL